MCVCVRVCACVCVCVYTKDGLKLLHACRKTWSVCHNLIVSNIEDRPILRIAGPSGGFVNFGSTYYPVSISSNGVSFYVLLSMHGMYIKAHASTPNTQCKLCAMLNVPRSTVWSGRTRRLAASFGEQWAHRQKMGSLTVFNVRTACCHYTCLTTSLYANVVTGSWSIPIATILYCYDRVLQY